MATDPAIKSKLWNMYGKAKQKWNKHNHNALQYRKNTGH